MTPPEFMVEDTTTASSGELALTEGSSRQQRISIPKVPGTIDLVAVASPQSDTVSLEIPEGVRLYSFTFG